MTALDAHLGRAKTAPYANAVTAPTPVAAAAPTLLTGSQLKTVQEPPPPRRRSALPVVIIVLVIALAAAAGVIAMHRSAPTPVTQTVAPKTETAAASTTSVNVTAPPEVVEEKKGDAAPTATSEPATTTTEAATTTEDVASAPEPERATESSADTLYATAMSELRDGDPQQARKTLHRVLRQDPHYAKAHFRMGEIALLNRNLIPATEELNLALGDADRLDAREQRLARIGLALAERNRSEVLRLADDIGQQWPDDPDLTRMRETFPGMFIEPRNQGRRRLRP